MRWLAAMTACFSWRAGSEAKVGKADSRVSTASALVTGRGVRRQLGSADDAAGVLVIGADAADIGKEVGVEDEGLGELEHLGRRSRARGWARIGLAGAPGPGESHGRELRCISKE